MKNIVFILLVSVAVSIVGCGGGATTDKRISMSGAFALYPLAVKWSEEYKKLHPDVVFDIQAGGAGKGMTDALSGTVSLGMFSREISQAEKDKGVWWIAVTKDAVLPTVNAKNGAIDSILTKGLKKSDFQRLFIAGEKITWKNLTGGNNDNEINVYTRSDASGAADVWAAFLGKKQEDLKGVGVSGDPGLADAVLRDVNGVGYNNTIYIYDLATGRKHDGLEVIPIDINENGVIDADERLYDTFESILNAIAVGKYPSPPARPLYFVAKGTPDATTSEFLKWVLSEGQKFVKEAGYVPLDNALVSEELKKLGQ